MKVEVTKGLVLCGLFFLTFILGLIPIMSISVARNRAHTSSRQHVLRAVISVFNCFAGGVFIGTCLLDLFPDVHEQLTHALNQLNIHTTFPVSEFVMLCGFYLVFVTEQIVLLMKDKRKSDELAKPLLVNSDSTPAEQSTSAEQQSGSRRRLARLISKNCSKNADENNSYTNIRYKSVHVDENDIMAESPASDNDSDYVPSEEHHDQDDTATSDSISHGDSLLRSLLLLLALSLHSVFEGLAVGLRDTSESVLTLFVALSLHKGVISFSLSLNLMQSKLKTRSVIKSIFVFSIMSPIGVGIGIGISDLSTSWGSHAAQALLQGIACGTFLFVTFFEILPHEFANSNNRMLKLLFVLLGYSVISVLILVQSGEKPSHGNHLHNNSTVEQLR